MHCLCSFNCSRFAYMDLNLCMKLPQVSIGCLWSSICIIFWISTSVYFMLPCSVLPLMAVDTLNIMKQELDTLVSYASICIYFSWSKHNFQMLVVRYGTNQLCLRKCCCLTKVLDGGLWRYVILGKLQEETRVGCSSLLEHAEWGLGGFMKSNEESLEGVLC